MKFLIKLQVALFAVMLFTAIAFGDIVFYGATKITVPTATSIDLKTNAMYRIFARCDYDGDISHKITMVSGATGSNWKITPSRAEKKVKYSVENSKGEIQTIEVPIVVSGNLIKVERTVYTLPKENIDAIQIAGTRRGDFQDRQHLGIFMQRNAKFSLKCINYNDFYFLGGLKVKMYQGHYSGNIERTFDMQGELKDFINYSIHDTAGGGTNGGIPFINTPIINSDKLPVIEITINPNDTSVCKTLNYYHYKDDRNTFWNGWVNDKYALIGGRSVQLMMPFDDKERYGSILDNSKIDKLLEFYDDFCDMYNRFHGLDINSTNIIHKKVHTKFFMAPQYEGYGYAFYEWGICGMNAPSLIGYLSTNFEENWVSLHEIGHGYDGNFTRLNEANLGEVTNNVLGGFYNSKNLDFTKAEDRKKSWVFDYAKDAGADYKNAFNALDLRAKSVRKGALNNFTTHFEGNQETYYDFREKLYILMTMFRGAGKNISDVEKLHAAVRRLDREMYAKGTPWTIGSLFTKGFADESKTNIVPFLDAYGFGPHITDMLRAQAYENDNQIAFFLDSLAPSSMGAIKAAENLWGVTELIKPGMRSINTGKINIGIDNFSLIEGKKLKIRNGATVVDEIEITSHQLTTKPLPIGAYYIEMPFPKGNAGTYLTGYNNLIIREGIQTPVSVEYKKPTASPIAGAIRIDLLGIYNELFSQLRYDPVNGKLSILTTGKEPHLLEYFTTYGKVEVYRGLTQKFTKEYMAQPGLPAAIDKIDVEIGDEIRIYHVEGGSPEFRAKAVNSITNREDNTNYTFTNSTTTLLVTEYGLVQKNSSEEMRQSMYTSNFNAFFNEAKVNNIDWKNPNAYQDIKTSLIYGSNLLSAKDKASFEKEIKYLYDCESNCYVVAVNSNNFPDDNFRAWILEQPWAADGVITGDEISKITDINVYGKDIKDLKGIEHFTELVSLACNDNKLTSLDLTNNTALRFLICNNNNLTELKLPNNSLLESLYCNNNKLTELDLSGYLALKLVYCWDNELKELDFSNNNKLRDLNCSNNQLTKLIVSAANNPGLYYLFCQNNQLASLDLKGFTLTAFDGSKQNVQMYLFQNGNNYYSADTKLSISALSASGITYSGGKITSNNKEIPSTLFVIKTGVEWYNLDGTINFTYINAGYVLINEENFPDDNFRAWALKQSWGVDGVITIEEIATISFIDVSGKSIADLTGIEHFDSLKILIASNNELTGLDVSKLTLLERLHCDNNYLTKLDVSNNLNLKYFLCYTNQLTSLNVTNNLELISLICVQNQLKSLDVTKNTKLEYLIVEENQLTYIDLTGLNITSFSGNNQDLQITLFGNGNNFSADIDLNNPQFSSVGFITYSNGKIISNDKKMPLTLFRTETGLVGKMLEGSMKFNYITDNVAINEFNFPDSTFRKWALAQPWGTDSMITHDEIAAISVIDVSTKGIADLKGIEFFDSLKILIASYNELTELDVSELKKLERLHCNNNYLTELDVSKNWDLMYLQCYTNNLTELDITENTELHQLICHQNQLTSLNVVNNFELTSLTCAQNQLKSLDVTQNPNLESLNVAENQLTYLDLSGNTLLTSFFGSSQKVSFKFPGGDNIYKIAIPMNNPYFYGIGARGPGPAEWISYADGILTLDGNHPTMLTFGLLDTTRFSSQTGLEGKALQGSMYFDFAPGELVIVNKKNFPDDNFRNWILAQSWGDDGVLTREEIAGIISIDVASQNIFDLTGIEHFDSLKILIASYNELTKLDVSKLKLLERLHCNNNYLTELNVSSNLNLKYLQCYANELTELDVTKNTKLIQLIVAENRLTNIDLSNNTDLTNFSGSAQKISLTFTGYNNYWSSAEIELYEPYFYYYPRGKAEAKFASYENGKIIFTEKIFDEVWFSVKVGNDSLTVRMNVDYVTVDIETFNVVFMDEIIIDSTKVANGDIVTKPATPTKENYNFVGWFNDEKEFDFLTPITEDLVLIAKFEPDATRIKPEPKEYNFYGIKLTKNIVSDKVEIRVILPEEAKNTEAKIIIYDITGNIVFDATTNKGEISWDLRNSAGRFVANGTYLVIVKAKDINGKIYNYSVKFGVKK